MALNAKNLLSIQRGLYEILDNHFVDFQTGYTPGTDAFEYTRSYLRSPAKNHFNTELNHLFDAVKAYWEEHAPSLKSLPLSSEYLLTQVGEINHHAYGFEEACTRLGFYFDGMCFIDPIFCGAHSRDTKGTVFDIRVDSFSGYEILDSLLILRSIKPLVFADTLFPIGVVLPPGYTFTDQDFPPLDHQGLEHNLVNSVFSEASGFQTHSFHEYANRFAKTSRASLISSLDNHPMIKALMSNYRGISCGEYANEFLQKRFGIRQYLEKQGVPEEFLVIATFYLILSNTFINIDRIEASASHHGIDHTIPFYDWELYKFRVETITQTFGSHDLREEIPIQRALLSDRLDWYAAATIDDLVQLRREGFMEELREIYRISRNSLREAEIKDVNRLADEVVSSVYSALRDTAKQIETQIDEERRKRLMLIPKVAFGILPFLFPQLGPVSLLIGGASLLDLVREYRQIMSEKHETLKRPTTHMLEIWERSASHMEIPET